MAGSGWWGTTAGKLRRVPGLVGIILIAAIVLTPAVGGAAAFLTKAKADKRYLGNTLTVRSSAIVPVNGFVILTATCPLGYQAIGGGAESPALLSTGGGTSGMVIFENKPVGGPRPTGWFVEARNNYGTAQLEISAVAVCAP